MPGIAWLALNPPKADAFPWWTGWFLDAFIGVGVILLLAAIALLVWVTKEVIGDEICERRRKRQANS